VAPGRKREDTGLLVLLAVDDSQAPVLTGYGLEGILPDGLVGRIQDEEMVPALKAGRIGDAMERGVRAFAARIAADKGVTLTGVPPPRAGRREAEPPSLASLLILFLFLALFIWMVSRSSPGSGSGFGRRRRGGVFLPGGYWGGGGGFGGGGGGGIRRIRRRQLRRRRRGPQLVGIRKETSCEERPSDASCCSSARSRRPGAATTGSSGCAKTSTRPGRRSRTSSSAGTT
jgi:hypothetical protein